MKTNRNLRMALSLALLLALPFVGRSQNTIPAAINYQGRLTDTLGNPVSSGYYEVQFRIWDDAVLANAGDLIWGRSFPLHVITNGVFNILLTDAGGQITTPTTATNSLLDAFSGPDRYLGLTITVSNNVPVSGPEINPRQQLASAPFAIQAQQANTVSQDGVSTLSLAAGAVTTEKIASGNVTSGNLADSAVTTAKIAAGAVTTAKIANGAVTSAKLNIEGDVHLNNHPLLLSTDTNSGLERVTSYGGFDRDAALLFGAAGGFLGTSQSNAPVLSWSGVAVGIEGRLDAYGSFVNLSSYVNAVTNTPVFTAQADGMMMFYGRRGHATLQIWDNGAKLFKDQSGNDGLIFWYNGNDNDGRSVMWPIRKGGKFQWNILDYSTDTSYAPINNYLFFLPLGKNQANSSISR